MSHSHDFAGARKPNAFTTRFTLVRGGTTCERRADHSAYWMPTLYQRGRAVHARDFRVYYRSGGFNGRFVQPFPRGLRIIAGDAMRADDDRPQPTTIASWACTRPGQGPQGNEIEVPEVPRTCGGLPLRVRIVFPQCWDGRHLDAPDHKSHMAYAVARMCPASHPVVLPQLTLSVRFWMADTGGLGLASGGTHSLHADFMPAWTGTALEDLVRRCINAIVDCKRTGAGRA
jgi:hypothetical protein